MDQTKIHWHVASLMELIQLLVFSHQAQTLQTVEKKYKDNIYNTPAGSGVAILGFNIDRQSYKHTAKKSDAEKSSTKKAILNKDFRQAITFALNRENYSAQVNSKHLLNQLSVIPTQLQPLCK